MKRLTLFRMFIRSLTVQVSFNFRRMQNLGFAFAMLPLAEEQRKGPGEKGAFLARHLQMFNTHPYLVSSIIGSVARIEEQASAPESTADLKKALMGPYAAIGDSFFWGALRSLSAAGALILALQGMLLAPFAFLLLYTPAHLWVRVRGFIEGYRSGRNGIDFIRALNLPKASAGIRRVTLVLTGLLAAVAVDAAARPWNVSAAIPEGVAGALMLLLAIAAHRLGISAPTILYGTGLLCMAVSVSL